MVWLNVRKIRICKENNLFQNDGMTKLLTAALKEPVWALLCQKMNYVNILYILKKKLILIQKEYCAEHQISICLKFELFTFCQDKKKK